MYVDIVRLICRLNLLQIDQTSNVNSIMHRPHGVHSMVRAFDTECRFCTAYGCMDLIFFRWAFYQLTKKYVHA